MFTLTYTSTKMELQRYLDSLFEEYLKQRTMEEERLFKVYQHYEKEIRILHRNLQEDPELLQGMCFMALLGFVAKKKHLMVSNAVTQCPFLMYLLGVASFDLFEEGYGENGSLLEESSINTTFYYVDEHFYKQAKDEIAKFLEKSGHLGIWIGRSGCIYIDDICDPMGIVVTTQESKVLEQKGKLGQLYGGEECILEEELSNFYDEGIVYELLPSQIERDELRDEEWFALDSYQRRVINKEETIKILSSEMIHKGYEDFFDYHQVMKKFGDKIYNREDLFQFLCEKGLDEKKAWYWTSIIRKGTLGRKLREHQVSYEDYVELYQAVGKERMDLFCWVKYLPTRWSVLERFQRLTGNDAKIIAVDFDGTLSMGMWPDVGPANEELFAFLKERKKRGDKLILWTCREGEELQDAVKWCKTEGLEFDAVNDNLPEQIAKFGTNSRKISCDYYIDDRAVWTNAFGLLK